MFDIEPVLKIRIYSMGSISRIIEILDLLEEFEKTGLRLAFYKWYGAMEYAGFIIMEIP